MYSRLLYHVFRLRRRSGKAEAVRSRSSADCWETARKTPSTNGLFALIESFDKRFRRRDILSTIVEENANGFLSLSLFRAREKGANIGREERAGEERRNCSTYFFPAVAIVFNERSRFSLPLAVFFLTRFLARYPV